MQSLHFAATSLLILSALGAQSCTSQDASNEASTSGVDVPADEAPDGASEGAEPVAPVPVMKEEGPWEAGDFIASGLPSGQNIEILEVRGNGEGDVTGDGKTATLKYVAMLADGTVLDPGTRPFSFRVGTGSAIRGWDVIVSKMRVGDSFSVMIPQELCYGPSKGDLKFDMELLSVR